MWCEKANFKTYFLFSSPAGIRLALRSPVRSAGGAGKGEEPGEEAGRKACWGDAGPLRVRRPWLWARGLAGAAASFLQAACAPAFLEPALLFA